MHTYMHAYRQTYMHTYIHTYLIPKTIDECRVLMIAWFLKGEIFFPSLKKQPSILHFDTTPARTGTGLCRCTEVQA